MRKIKSRLKNKKGSMMTEYLILLVVGLLVLGGFLLFLDQGGIFAEKSFRQIGNMEKSSDSTATLGKFKRIE